jgi:hypothetical protein
MILAMARSCVIAALVTFVAVEARADVMEVDSSGAR